MYRFGSAKKRVFKGHAKIWATKTLGCKDSYERQPRSYRVTAEEELRPALEEASRE